MHQTLPEEMRPAFESMIYYPVLASLNIIELNLAAGNNAELARRGVLAANDEIVRMAEKVALDQSYVEEFHAMEGGKWKHMMDSAHTGFRGWDDNDWTYPSAKTVYPIPRGKITVSFRGNNAYHLGAHWQDSSTLTNEEMLRPDCNKIILDIDSRGNVDFQYTVHCTVPWLSFSSMEGKYSEYFAEWQNETWSYGVTNHVRIVKEEVILKKGVNTLKFYAADPNIVLENIVMFREDRPMRVTHLAPPESWF